MQHRLELLEQLWVWVFFLPKACIPCVFYLRQCMCLTLQTISKTTEKQRVPAVWMDYPGQNHRGPRNYPFLPPLLRCVCSKRQAEAEQKRPGPIHNLTYLLQKVQPTSWMVSYYIFFSSWDVQNGVPKLFQGRRPKARTKTSRHAVPRASDFLPVSWSSANMHKCS